MPERGRRKWRGVRRCRHAVTASRATWLIAALDRDPACAGWVVWRLVGRLVGCQDGNRWPADTDGFDVKADDSQLWTTISNEMHASTAPIRRAQEP